MSKIDFSQAVSTANRDKAERIEEELVLATASLAETDWMIIREFESGKKTPKNVKEERAALRALISNLRLKLIEQR